MLLSAARPSSTSGHSLSLLPDPRVGTFAPQPYDPMITVINDMGTQHD